MYFYANKCNKYLLWKVSKESTRTSMSLIILLPLDNNC